MTQKNVCPIVFTARRVLIVTDNLSIKNDLINSYDLENMGCEQNSAAHEIVEKLSDQAKHDKGRLDLVCTSNEKDALRLVELAAQHNPFGLVIIDGRLIHGDSHRQIIQRLWQIQGNLYLVIHAYSHVESFEQTPIKPGGSHKLLVFKSCLAPFEMIQLVRTLTITRESGSDSFRNLSLETQILEAAKRFEGVCSMLRLEQEDRRQIEELLCRKQRLETVGRFTDTMTHFFNNYLTVIQGHLSKALLSGNADARASFEELLVATKHAAGVTAQFMAFNRREYLCPVPTSLSQLIDSQVTLLQKALGEGITIQVKHAANLPLVKVDPAYLEQCIFNLIFHSRGNMPQGGMLAIDTRWTRIPDAVAAGQIHEDAIPGDYVIMTISDTSQGISPSDLSSLFDASKIFEDDACGGDMALVLVRSMLRLQGGWVQASSVQEVGTEFSIYLPVGIASECTTVVAGKLLEPPAGTKSSTILIVDDEESVRIVMESALTSQGHKVLTASNAIEAWEHWRSRGSSINLVITDIRMPNGISGFDLARNIKEMDPTVPVVFTCGYCPSKIENAVKLEKGDNYLSKPFGMNELLNIVGHALLKPCRL